MIFLVDSLILELLFCSTYCTFLEWPFSAFFELIMARDERRCTLAGASQ